MTTRTPPLSLLSQFPGNHKIPSHLKNYQTIAIPIIKYQSAILIYSDF